MNSSVSSGTGSTGGIVGVGGGRGKGEVGPAPLEQAEQETATALAAGWRPPTMLETVTRALELADARRRELERRGIDHRKIAVRDWQRALDATVRR